MTSRRTLHDLFLSSAAEQPERPALVHPQLVLSRKDLAAGVAGFAHHLRRHGVGPGTRVALSSRALTTTLNMLLALSAVGGTLVRGASGNPADFIATDLTFFSREPGLAVPANGIEIDATWLNAPTALGPVEFLPEDAAIVTQALDGAAVSISHADLAARALAFLWGAPSPLNWACTLPPTDLAFVERALACLIGGGTIVTTTDRSFWERAGVSMATAPAAVLETLLEPRALAALQVADLVGASGSAVPAGLLALVPAVRHVYAPPATGPAWARLTSRTGEESAGFAAGLDIAGPDAEPLAPGRDGVLRVRLADGRTILPGDVGHWGQSGDLVLVADAADTAIIDGVPLKLADIEAEMETIEGVRRAAAFRNPKPGAPAELFAFLVLADGYNAVQLREIARSRVRRRFGAAAEMRVIQIVSDLPLKADHTPDRVACAAFILKLAAERTATA